MYIYIYIYLQTLFYASPFESPLTSPGVGARCQLRRCCRVSPRTSRRKARCWQYRGLHVQNRVGLRLYQDFSYGFLYGLIFIFEAEHVCQGPNPAVDCSMNMDSTSCRCECASVVRAELFCVAAGQGFWIGYVALATLALSLARIFFWKIHNKF